MFSRPGSLPGRLSQVLLPITILWPIVVFLKYFISSLTWNTKLPLAPSSRFLPTAAMILNILLRNWHFDDAKIIVIVEADIFEVARIIKLVKIGDVWIDPKSGRWR